MNCLSIIEGLYYIIYTYIYLKVCRLIYKEIDSTGLLFCTDRTTVGTFQIAQDYCIVHAIFCQFNLYSVLFEVKFCFSENQCKMYTVAIFSSLLHKLLIIIIVFANISYRKFDFVIYLIIAFLSVCAYKRHNMVELQFTTVQWPTTCNVQFTSTF